ncbi:uncharacterized protein LOC6566452 isoform X2 [Drosophila grimshawi]|uniref:uncharacterized protein LOC6566452 isoform X2 n=1 Tax=Drosophila grimshawi TaxID=7222 RepID=UPI000C86E98B|nr:uncharacterized protein LOC6566452 isoform X2 [Drosophila grimshawi]
MGKKLVFTLVLASFVGSFVDGLRCYTCNSPTISCNAPYSQVCNSAVANQTSNWLRTIHSDVPDVNSNNFTCMEQFYNASNNVREILGCVHSVIPVCNLTVSTQWTQNCRTCNWDNCNRNPAGTHSRSTYTIMASTMALLLVKLSIKDII